METYLREIQCLPGIDPQNADHLLRLAAGGDGEAQEKVLLAHLPFVVRIACKYVGYGLPLADLVSEGNLGLIRAVELFQPKYGVEFTIYAGVWIKQRIHRAITSQAQAVRIPVWRSQRLRKLDRLHEALNSELGRDADFATLAERIGVTEADLNSLTLDRIQVHSIDAQDAFAESFTRFSDESASPPWQRLSQGELREEIAASLHGLNDIELQVLSLKFGLADEPPESYREMAPRFGRSREWIRKIGETALRKVAKSFHDAAALPRSLVETRKKKAQEKLRRLARKHGEPPQKLSLFQIALIHWMEPLFLIL